MRGSTAAWLFLASLLAVAVGMLRNTLSTEEVELNGLLRKTATVELELGMLRQDLEKLHANLAAQHSQIEECQDEKVSMFLGARKYNDTKTNCVERVADCKHALIVLRSHLGPVEERLRQQGDKLKAEEDALRQTAEKLDEWKSEVLHSMEEAQQTRSSIKAADAAADAQDVTQLIAAAD